MNNQPYFSRTDHIFNIQAITRIPYLVTNQPRLVTTPQGISAINQVESLLNNPTTGWIHTFGLFNDPLTKTSKVTESKNFLHETMISKLQLIYRDIPRTILTDDDRAVLGIHRHDSTQTHIALVDYVPTIIIEQIKSKLIIFRISDPLAPDSSAMPHGHHCNLAVGFKATPTGPIIWDINRIYEPHESLFSAHFRNEDKGKEAFYCVRYVNNSGEIGDWGDIYSSIVI